VRVERVLAIAFIAVAAHAGAAELRTLFHSSEERERLDKLRRGEPLEPPAPPPAAAPPRPKAVTGFVQRSDGKGTVWIDGKPHAFTGRAPAPSASTPREGAAIEIKPTR
jgi:hypothetical protein